MKISNYPRRLLQSRTTRIIRQRTNLNGALAMALVLSLSTLAFLVSAQNETAPQVRHKHLESVPGQLLVRFRPTSEFAKLRRKASAGLGLAFKGRTLRVEIQQFGGSELVDGLMLGKVAPSDTLEAISALNARSDVLYAEPNYVRHINAVPSDPHYVDQFALKNSAPGGAGISAESAWDTTTGNHNVVVGVIDSGIDIDHRDLKDNIFVNTGEIANNGMDDDGNGFPDDVNGWDFVNHDRTVFDNANEDAHGTHVAGTIFVIRPEFIATYPESMSPAAFVDALNATAGNVLTQSERDAFVAAMIAGTKGRGDVVRAIAESPVVSAREFNSAFVVMQYFGYLRRNPDSAPDTNFDGYNFWLNKLNQFGGDFRAAEMVKAFIVSGEYRHRFGP